MDKPILQLPIATALTGNEATVVVQQGVTKQTSVSQVANAISPGKLIVSSQLSGSDLVFNYSDGTNSNVGPVVATATAGTTSTLSPGSSATVTNVGTTQNAVFNFGIPQGAVGPAGAGVAIGGTTGQVLTKLSNANYDTTWTTGGTVTSVAALTIGTTGTNITSTVANGTTTPVITLNIPTASATNRGALSSADWSTFNSKGNGTVTSASVVSANGFAGTVATSTTTPAITLSTTVTGLLKGNGTAISAATSGVDYAPATSGTSILYGNGSGGFSNVTVGTGLSFTTGTLSATNAGTVTSVSGIAPIASTGGATPTISISQATTSTDGYLSSTDWNTFNNKGSGTVTSVAALTIGTTGTDLSSTVANGTTTPIITLNVPTASSSNRGALSSTDWSTFNGKQAALVSGTNIKTVNGTTLLGSGDLGTIGSGYGGTGFSTYATGDLIYASATNTLSKLPAGTNGFVLTLAGGVPTWAAGGGGGSGTVTSVGLSAPSIFTVTNSPVTSSGTLTLSYSGTALPVANGGTGQTSFTDGQLLIGNTGTGGLNAAVLTAGAGIGITNNPGSILITNTGGGGGGVSGVTASAPLASSGGSTPNISITQASSSTNGFLSSTDWNTFNSKGNGTVTSITAGTGLSGGTITSSGTIAIDSTVATLTGSQVLTNKTISGSTNTLSNIGNSSLTNSTITINGTSTSLGGSINVGTVTSVTGTSPVVSSGGATPAISMPAATTSVSGYLTSTDWTTFNSKANSGANTDITSVALTTGTISTAPTASTDIVNKSYADSIASGINFHAACQYATTTALPTNTYNNGSSGVGATLTANANGILTIDGHTFVSGDVGKRILVKDESAAANNGVYTLTQRGTGLQPYILTRATDFNTVGSGVNQIDQGDLFLITNGIANANTSWVQQTPLPITVGTTAIVFIEFAKTQTYTAGTGLTLTTNQFSISNIGTAGTYGSATLIPVITTNAQGQVTGVTTASNPQGTVTSVSGTGSVNGITLTGTVTSSGSLTLGGTLGSIANSQLTNSSVTVNGTAIALGASGTITATATNALTIGSGLSGTSYNGSTAVTIANSAPMTYPTGSGIAVVVSGTSWGTTLTAPSGAIVGTTDTQTLTNKRVTPRVLPYTGNTSTPLNGVNSDDYDMIVITGQSTTPITNMSTGFTGTPTNGQKLWISITGSTAIAITSWGSLFEASTVPLPTTTVSSNRLDVGFVWNVTTSKWRCVASA